MKIRSILASALLVLCAANPALADLPNSCAKSAGGKYAKEFEIPCQVLDDFINAFNSGDGMAIANTLNYPHVRFTNGEVHIWEKPEDYAKDQDLSQMTKAFGWKYSDWDYRYVVQHGPDGTTGNNRYHVALSFTRYDQNNKPIPGKTFDSFYIITKDGDKWGIVSRSSMAGNVHGRSGY